jgi:hypothetical protein
LEKVISEFNNRAYRLDLIPASAPNADGLNFEIRLDSNSIRADQMLSIDLRGPVKVRKYNFNKETDVEIASIKPIAA